MIKNYPQELLPIENNKINRCIYVTPRGTVIKNCTESANYPDPVDTRLEAFCEFGPIVSFTYPFVLLANEENFIYGYEMEYLKDYHTLLAFIKDPKFHLSFEQKRELLFQIYADLKIINKSFVVGDINLQNILLDKNGKGKVIDWENGYPLQSTLTSLSLYSIKGLTDLQQDAVKMFITSLSLLYKTDFERLFSEYDLSQMYEFAVYNKLDAAIIDYLSDFMYIIYTNSKEVIYFDDYLNRVHPIGDFTGSRVRRLVDKEIYVYSEK